MLSRLPRSFSPGLQVKQEGYFEPIDGNSFKLIFPQQDGKRSGGPRERLITIAYLDERVRCRGGTGCTGREARIEGGETREREGNHRIGSTSAQRACQCRPECGLVALSHCRGLAVWRLIGWMATVCSCGV